MVMIRVAYYIIKFTKGANKSHILGRRTDNTMKKKRRPMMDKILCRNKRLKNSNPLKPGMKSGAPRIYAVSVPLVAPVGLLINDKKVNLILRPYWTEVKNTLSIFEATIREFISYNSYFPFSIFKLFLLIVSTIMEYQANLCQTSLFYVTRQNEINI